MLKAPAGAGGPVGAVCSLTDLSPFIETGKIGCLNNDPRDDASSIISSHGVLRSDPDVDEQLIIVVPFQSKVKINSISFVSESADGASGPKHVKLFKDRPDMDFADAEDSPATQDLALSPKDLSDGSITKLQFVKFQNVTSLTIFVSDNQEDTDVTVINSLVINGIPIDGMNVSAIKKSG